MNTTHNVWIVDDDKSIRWVLEKAFLKTAINTRCFNNGADLLQALKFERPNAILTDIRMPGIDGLELLEQIQNQYPDLPVIIMTAHSDLDSAVTSFNKGAFEYLPKPLTSKKWLGLSIAPVNTKAAKFHRLMHKLQNLHPKLLVRHRPCKKFFALLAAWLNQILPC